MKTIKTKTMCSNNYGNDFIQRAKISDNKLVQEYCQERNLVFGDYTYQQSLEDFAKWLETKINLKRFNELEAEIKNLKEIKTMLQESFIEMSKISIELAKLNINGL